MAARLAVTLGVLGIALVFVGAGEGAEAATRGLYRTLAVAFLATIIFAAALPRVRNVSAYGALQLAVDLTLVTGVLLFSGGARSIFSFLYLPLVVFGSSLFDRRGGYGVALAASFGFALVVLGAEGSAFGSGSSDPLEVKLAIWGVHTGALLLVGLLSSTLAGELRAADQRLRDSRTELSRLEFLHERTVESLTSGLMTTDVAGHVTSCNPEGQRILGQGAAELLGRPLGEIVEGFSGLMEEQTPEGRSRRRVTRLGEDGHSQFLGVALSALRSQAGQPDGHVVIFQDVTDVVELEAQLARNARLAGVGELAASIAHEIRNPLAAISGSVEMLEAEAPPEERSRLRAIVLREITRLDRLIGDFLVYARPSETRLGPVEIAPLVSEIALGAKAARTEMEVDVPDGVRILADRDQLQQVLWNLIRNADQAMDGRGTVGVVVRTVAAAPQAGSEADRRSSGEGVRFVEIAVTDNGSGIETAVLERIFDPFFTTKPEGTGLGLPTVHRILEAHHATIQVESRVGAGTTMRLSFPALDLPDTEKS
jgi:two-component system sensor histidine kinase PilS (NtrC family)